MPTFRLPLKSSLKNCATGSQESFRNTSDCSKLHSRHRDSDITPNAYTYPDFTSGQGSTLCPIPESRFIGRLVWGTTFFIRYFITLQTLSTFHSTSFYLLLFPNLAKWAKALLASAILCTSSRF